MNQYNKTETLRDKENKLVVTTGERERERSKIGVGVKRYKLLCIK